jgi:nucleotide-binding universal stress UspA family protein
LKKIHKILIGIAFSPNLKPNLFEAIRIANFFNAELIGVHVGEKTTNKEKDLNAVLSEADALNIPLKTIWQKGEPVDVILKTSVDEDVDLLILGALKKEKLLKYYVGSIARKITRKASCSILLLIKPSIIRQFCKHIVVNGLKDDKTEETIKTAVVFANHLLCKKMTIVEEISQSELQVKVNDDKSLRKSTIVKERLKNREDRRVKNILKEIDCTDISIKTQSIFGTRGYSIGHYAKVKRADLLVMNAPNKIGILSELPTDVLIVK